MYLCYCEFTQHFFYIQDEPKIKVELLIQKRHLETGKIQCCSSG